MLIKQMNHVHTHLMRNRKRKRKELKYKLNFLFIFFNFYNIIPILANFQPNDSQNKKEKD